MISSPLQRGRQSTGRTADVATGHPSDRIASAQRAERRDRVSIAITRVPAGLLLQREEVPAQGPRTLVVTVFQDRASFMRWCDEDPIRFDQPLMLHQLRREGDELWRVSTGI